MLIVKDLDQPLRKTYPPPYRLYGLSEKMYESNEWCFRRLVANIFVGGSMDEAAVAATAALFEQLSYDDLWQPLQTDDKQFRIIADLLEEYDIKYAGKKAKHVILASEMVEKDFRGVVPFDRGALESLPGVGHHAASVVLTLAFGDPKTFAVDLHVRRIVKRMGIISEDASDQEIEERFLAESESPGFLSRAFVDFGKNVCSYVPSCRICAFNDGCAKKTSIR